LAIWAKLVERDPKARATVPQTLRHWQSDPDLKGLRDNAELARLPKEEREECRQLWADVEALLKRTRSPK
jgi:hypothetical protein